MTFTPPKEEYKSSIHEVVLGQVPKALRIGGENAPALHFFEGRWPNPPRFAMEVRDIPPSDPSDLLAEHFADVWTSPVAWARKCVNTYGAEAICLYLAGTDPIERDTSPEDAAALVKEVAKSVDVPLLVYGSGTEDKDTAVLSAVAKVCAGRNLALGPLVKKNFQAIGQAALEGGHTVIIQTALEIPEAKEISLKLTKTFPVDKVLYDPISPALGYGLEYGYSVMERMKLAGCSFGDPNLRMPLVANIGKECGDIKEVKESKSQGLLWEAMAALSFLLAGADLLIISHPDIPRLLRKITGGN